ncbi:hypothetical protein QBC42DRAFT_181050 [Cladorrhinum samala]|uniref:Heterokaryon incompatibility domain-containing protein n=1 Tax=Cladorrhinum samala TaxID=585594 RepID=A0AAV9HI54_9PEZI|nr:hypothetical protein QBC42DRAFT_181050 [Cladorrhinum samala]
MASYNAIVIDDVDETALLRGSGLRSINHPDRLPLKQVAAPFLNAAVLSWRWDGIITEKHQSSRNVASAIRHAKNTNTIRYLFVDQVSIDQSLPAEKLLQQVASFSTLYKTIPVIAAYDNPGGGEEFSTTVLRPWIYSEARLFRHNPTKITYVSHDAVLPVKVMGYSFSKELRAAWLGSFMKTIAGLLVGDIKMKDIGDLKFILPPLAPALAAAHKAMSPNDYLLTAILLCSVSAEGSVRARCDITEIKFDRYTFTQEHCRDGYRMCWTFRDILLDGVTVGAWRCKDNVYMDMMHYFVDASDDRAAAEANILDRLPMADADRRLYAEQEAQRRAYIVLDNESGPPPVVEIVSVQL